MKGKALLRLFWVLVPVIIRFALVSYPCIVDVKIEAASVKGGTLRVEGMITVDPKKVPPELRYNYDDGGFLDWWEQNINNVIAQSKFWSKFVYVKSIALEWVQIGEKNGQRYDVIRFVADVEVTMGKAAGKGK